MKASAGKTYEVLALSPAQLNEQLETVLDFIKLVHPSLMDKNDKTCVEIRAITRNQKDTPYVLYHNSFNIWQLREKDVNALKNWLEMRNGYPLCVFYSVYSFDSDKESVTKDGVAANKGKVTISNSIECEEVPLDFDHIDEATMLQYDAMFDSVGIHPLWVYTGHSYQAHILLSEKLHEKDTLKYLVHLIRSKELAQVDVTCTDAARMMRLPGTFNAKCFTENSKYISERKEPMMCRIAKESTERISVNELEYALESLQTKDMDEYIFALTIRDAKCPDKVRSAKAQPVVETVHEVKPEYPVQLLEMMKQEEFPEAVRRALTVAPEGCRHSTMAFLMKFLSKYYGFSASQVRDVLRVWSTVACKPAMDEDFDATFTSLWPGDYKYDLKEIAKQYGFIDLKGSFPSTNDFQIRIPNMLLNSLSEMGNAAVSVYIALAMAQHDEKPQTVEVLQEYTNLSGTAVRKQLKSLCAQDFIYTVKGCRSKGIPNTYKTSEFPMRNKGYLAVGYLEAKDYLNLFSSELCVLLLLRRQCMTQVNGVINQTALSKVLGCTRSNVCIVMKKLEMKGYIKVEQQYIDRVMYRLVVKVKK